MSEKKERYREIRKINVSEIEVLYLTCNFLPEYEKATIFSEPASLLCTSGEFALTCFSLCRSSIGILSQKTYWFPSQEL